MRGLDTSVRYHQSSTRLSEASRKLTKVIGFKTCIIYSVNGSGLKRRSGTFSTTMGHKHPALMESVGKTSTMQRKVIVRMKSSGDNSLTSYKQN